MKRVVIDDDTTIFINDNEDEKSAIEKWKNNVKKSRLPFNRTIQNKPRETSWSHYLKTGERFKKNN